MRTITYPALLQRLKLRMEALENMEPGLNKIGPYEKDAVLALIQSFETLFKDYNDSILELKSERSVLRQLEKELKDVSEQLLLTVASMHGKNSEQYVRIGGIRKSERKRPKPRTPSNESI